MNFIEGKEEVSMARGAGQPVHDAIVTAGPPPVHRYFVESKKFGLLAVDPRQYR